MVHQDQHLSDSELLMAADGELSARRASQVRSHLAACWTCRTRLTEIEVTIARFVHAHNNQLESRLPPVAGSRALLRAQLADLAWKSQANPGAARLRWRGLAFAGLSLSLVLVMTFMRHSSPSWSEPRSALTPGVVRQVTVSDVCMAEPQGQPRVIPASLQRKVFEEYGIASAKPSAYEVDYLITPELGGADDLRNLWPEPYAATIWNAHVKDALEERLRRMVCEGRLDLATAQRDIATDWISAYKKYFHSDRPLTRRELGRLW